MYTHNICVHVHTYVLCTYMYSYVLYGCTFIVYYYRKNGELDGGTGSIGHIPSQNLTVLLTNNHVLPTVECAEEATFTFGYKDKGDNKGTTVNGDELLDMKQWWTNPSFVENLVCVIASITNY